MSVHDRDWYHQAQRRPSWENREGAGGRFLFALVGIAAAVILVIYAAQQWARRDLPPRSESPVYLNNLSPVARLPTTGTPAREVTATMTERATNYKCIVNGVVTYLGPLDCRGAMPLAAPIEAQVRRAGEPPGLTDYQRQMLRSADARIARDQAAARADMTARGEAALVSRTECASLEEAIRSLDAQARQPLSGWQQDALRTARQRARSRQSALHC